MKTKTIMTMTSENLIYSSSDDSLDMRFDPNAWGVPEAAVTDLEADFEQLCTRYQPLFTTQTRDTSVYGQVYISGLLRNPHKQRTFTGIAESTGVSEQNLHHFMSNSPWHAQPVIDHLQSDIAALCQDDPIAKCALILDESGDKKASQHTLGVSRQYLGRLGKVDLCQMGVYLAYTTPTVTQLVEGELYLPAEWFTQPFEDKRRQLKLDENRVFKTKAELGLQMIRRVRDNGTLRFSYVACDDFYGRQPSFLFELLSLGVVYIADVPVNTRVYPNLPTMGVKKRNGSRGRRPSLRRSLDVKLQSLSQIAKQLPDDVWQRLKIRNTERGDLIADFAALRIWTQQASQPQVEQWVVFRRDLSGQNRLSAALCNAPKETPLSRLAEMKCTRFWVEHSIENAKSEIGLDELCAQNYQAWQHHLVLSLLALYFIEEVRQKWQRQYPANPQLKQQFEVQVLPRLSVANIRTLLRARFPLPLDTVQSAQQKVVKHLVNRTRSRRSHLKTKSPS
jgi:SRSO17 transposase